MATLHAAPALCALPDGHMKAPDDRPDDGEIFLVLRRHALQCHHPAAPRTRRRERGPRRSHQPWRESGGAPGAHTGGRLVGPAARRGPGTDPWRTARPAGTPPAARLQAAAAGARAAASIDRTHAAGACAHVAPDPARVAADPAPAPFALPPSAAARPPRRPAGSARPDRRWNACAHRPRDTYDRLVRIVQVQNIGFE